ncbi:UDP-N-acetylglucosamine--N-acetylmuramyl-(pentapeptide) pyrophosphoryl-undecaprenol N-acetylglucosamine transferase [Croceivirga thetidis]|uniref:UDP-N-acetylglucosamine--N-acetylmuramyl-(Pentapeptide) pyrophosphoryl-undecaprenol N-acetylglucosamine transferase n=1 Tax=Croceivirga thetidis TaxID=2721623 RepID=A0ABX1GNU8_9FLAO|nr:UDP-N-acetylglucosamine--N-acetylmuramyl-(pentapeptide) pyrophosphoryl-undecaprenol N-acetylglucosamine transferase [Croceivirga thetidis]NKI31598.1 UDP-N-acetylglucosamine--N-acetylmuramyl-(pentapeptide) pyrophosphoryl-undecaprenol N-acetylglucosamine transferase [Croceivirga thetidis]
MPKPKRILVAPLNWGLGHATRCIPIIKSLLNEGFEVYIASDGVALKLLQKEFPRLTSFELPSYKIKYAEKGKNFKIKMIWDSPKVLKAMAKEKKEIKKIIKEFKINGIISDNRLGAYSKKIPSVFMTHQLNVLSGNTTWFSSKMHQKIIKKFTECWVPDVDQKPNLTGKLGHLKKTNDKVKYLGPLSRFEKRDFQKVFDLMVLLSGPEPQRTFLEEKLLNELKSFDGRVLFVKGKIENEQHRNWITQQNNFIEVVNFMQSNELEVAINSSELILSRSGYTTVMDLAKLEKKAFFIPTPGQYEQEYLAKRLNKHRLVPYSKQNEFCLADLKKVKSYDGLTNFDSSIDISSLFEVFSRVKENSEPTSSSLST